MNKIINYLRTIFGSSKVEMVEVNEPELMLDPVWEETIEQPTTVEIIEEPKIVESIVPNVDMVTEVVKSTKKSSHKRKSVKNNV